MALAGLGAALTMVSTYGRAHSAALRLGYKDNICTYLLVSSKLIFSLTMISPKKNTFEFLSQVRGPVRFSWEVF